MDCCSSKVIEFPDEDILVDTEDKVQFIKILCSNCGARQTDLEERLIGTPIQELMKFMEDAELKN